ncbi:MAG: hypothetical protein QM760_20180 [Nibricoccus sp.]
MKNRPGIAIGFGVYLGLLLFGLLAMSGVAPAAGESGASSHGLNLQEAHLLFTAFAILLLHVSGIIAAFLGSIKKRMILATSSITLLMIAWLWGALLPHSTVGFLDLFGFFIVPVILWLALLFEDEKEPNQSLQRNASTGSVSNLESPARRG